MRKNSKVLFLSLMVFFAVILTLTGCGVTVSCPTCESSCGPSCQQCWLEVTSASSDVWGYVWIEGNNSGVYLNCFSTVRVPAPCNQQVVVQVVDQWGVGSHWEYVYIRPGVNGVNCVTYYYW
ncbi:MAG TPA: hypothetical protein PLQ27_00250 [Candidatus Paceibacterota bacterium]|nr:hypothetical protein [Candidatus Paceibacterota bacterium]